MPTYDYRCEQCGYEFEEFHKINEPPVETCPQCAGKTRRLVSGGAGIIFKGSGFYVTDYKKKNGAAENTGSTQPASSPESK